MRNVRSMLLAIVVAFALVGAASSTAYAFDPVELVPSALPDPAAPSTPAVFTDNDPVAALGIATLAGGGASKDYFDPGDPGLPPD